MDKTVFVEIELYRKEEGRMTLQEKVGKWLHPEEHQLLSSIENVKANGGKSFLLPYSQFCKVMDMNFNTVILDTQNDNYFIKVVEIDVDGYEQRKGVAYIASSYITLILGKALARIGMDIQQSTGITSKGMDPEIEFLSSFSGALSFALLFWAVVLMRKSKKLFLFSIFSWLILVMLIAFSN